MKLSDQQMLAIWRRLHRLEPARSDCSIEVFEGYDVEAAMTLDMRQWYLHLLDTADLQYLVLTDVATQLQLKNIAEGVWQAALPADVRRLFSLQVSGCTHQTDVRTVDAARRDITLNTNRYSRSGTVNPVAVCNGRMLTVYCMTADGSAPQIVSAQAVVDPGDEWYVFDELALSLIQKNTNYLNE